MPRPKRVPAYRLHKPSGQARVIVDGRHRYLGPYGSVESREAYARLIAEQCLTAVPAAAAAAAALAAPDGSGTPDVGPGAGFAPLSVNELLVAFLAFAEGYYVANGRPTGEVRNLKDAAGPLRALYGSTDATRFGPRALKAVREHMIASQELSRGVVNDRVDRIKRIFKWAVSEELVPPSVYEGLRTVSGLRFGRTPAREPDPVAPVTDEVVDATLPFLPPHLQDMVRLQRLSAAATSSTSR